MKLVSRKKAKEAQQKFYFTGKPCKKGHIDLRYTSVAVCKSCKEDYRSLYYSINKKVILEKDKFYRKHKKKPDSDFRKAYNKFYNRKRYAAKLRALPNWANLEKIKDIYLNCPKGYHVDHEIPLQNKLVCGLHVENNLQYLSAEDNLKKGNHFEVVTILGGMSSKVC